MTTRRSWRRRGRGGGRALETRERTRVARPLAMRWRAWRRSRRARNGMRRRAGSSARAVDGCASWHQKVKVVVNRGVLTGVGAESIPWCMTHGILPMQPNISHDPAFATRNTRRRKTRRETRARAAAAEGAANAPLADSHRRPRESLGCVPRDPGPSGPSLPARPLARPGVADSVIRRPVLVVSPWSLRVRTARPRTAPRRALAPATLPPIPRG